MTKATTNGALPLDVRLLHRRGALKPGSRSSWRWWRGSDPASGSSIACVCLSATACSCFISAGPEARRWSPYSSRLRCSGRPATMAGSGLGGRAPVVASGWRCSMARASISRAVTAIISAIRANRKTMATARCGKPGRYGSGWGKRTAGIWNRHLLNLNGCAGGRMRAW